MSLIWGWKSVLRLQTNSSFSHSVLQLEKILPPLPPCFSLSFSRVWTFSVFFLNSFFLSTFLAMAFSVIYSSCLWWCVFLVSTDCLSCGTNYNYTQSAVTSRPCTQTKTHRHSKTHKHTLNPLPHICGHRHRHPHAPTYSWKQTWTHTQTNTQRLFYWILLNCQGQKARS